MVWPDAVVDVAEAGYCPSPGTVGGCEGQPCSSSNQVTVRPPCCREPQRAARRSTRLSPRPPSASRSSRRSSGTPGPLWSVTSTRTMPLSDVMPTVIVPPRTARGAVPTLLPKSSPARRRPRRKGARVRDTAGQGLSATSAVRRSRHARPGCAGRRPHHVVPAPVLRSGSAKGHPRRHDSIHDATT